MGLDKYRPSKKLNVAAVLIGLAAVGTIAFAYSSTKYKNSIQPAVAENKPDIATGRVDSTVGKQASVQSDNFEIQDSTAKAVLKIDGMSCSGCIYTIKSALSGLIGIKDIFVNIANGGAEVYYDKKELKDVNSIPKSITESGYPSKIVRIMNSDEIKKQREVAIAKARNYIASVGGFDISRDNFDTEFNYAKNRYAQIYGPEVFATDQGKELAKNLKTQVVSRLINEGIQMQEIQRSGFAVDSKLKDVEFKTFLETMDINLDQFESGLKKRGYTLDYFRKKFEINVLIKRYLDEKVLTGITNDFEKQQRYSSWFNNAQLLAKVVFYDRELERLVRAQAASGGCSGGGSCSTGKDR